MIRRRLVAAVVLAGAALTAVAPAATAQDVDEAPDPTIVSVGWWTRSPGQQAPANGMAVATGPDGPVTVAAISVQVGQAEVVTASFEAVETGGFAQEGSSIQACVSADTGWQAVEGGPLDEAPKASCDDSVLLSRDGDAELWTGEIGTLFAGKSGTVTIVFVPGTEPSQAAPPAPPVPGAPAPPPPAVAPAFDVRLAAPKLDGSSQPLSDGEGGEITFTDSSSGSSGDSGSASSAAGSDYAVPDTSGGAFASPPPAAPAAPAGGDTAAAGDPASTPTPDAGGAEDGGEQAFQPLGASAGEDRPWGRALLYVLIAGVLGAGAAGGRWYLRERVL